MADDLRATDLLESTILLFNGLFNDLKSMLKLGNATSFIQGDAFTLVMRGCNDFELQTILGMSEYDLQLLRSDHRSLPS
jgi:hypothetical protein